MLSTETESKSRSIVPLILGNSEPKSLMEAFIAAVPNGSFAFRFPRVITSSASVTVAARSLI